MTAGETAPIPASELTERVPEVLAFIAKFARDACQTDSRDVMDWHDDMNYIAVIAALGVPPKMEIPADADQARYERELRSRPQDWRMVPHVPTDAMVDALVDCVMDCGDYRQAFILAVNAAPTLSGDGTEDWELLADFECKRCHEIFVEARGHYFRCTSCKFEWRAETLCYCTKCDSANTFQEPFDGSERCAQCGGAWFKAPAPASPSGEREQ